MTRAGTSTAPFRGAKAALLNRGRVVVLRRDDRPDVAWRGQWDLPGGARDGGETPEATVLREIAEETGLGLAPADLPWRRAYVRDGRVGWLFVGHLPDAALLRLRLGAEGQALDLMPIDGFLAHPRAVPFLQDRLRDALGRGAAAPGPRAPARTAG